MSTNLDKPIEKIKAFRVRVPLPNPLHVFGNLITEREFIFVEAHANGQIGRGFGLSRNMPIVPLIEQHIVPFAEEQPIGVIRAIWDSVRESAKMIGEHGVFARALALVDIALWDLKGQLLGEPLWRLLGGAMAKIPVIAIAGYYQENAVESLKHETAALLDEGYRSFKIPFGLDADLDQQRLNAFREVAGMDVELGLDASAAYLSVKAVLTELKAIEKYHIAFFEDPFPASNWSRAVELSQSTHIPIAFGESISDIATMQQLASADGIDVFRPDATHQMGITGYLQSIAVAQEYGKTIFPHYFPDIHASLVGGFGGTMIEESPPQADTVGFRQLRGKQPVIVDGFWHLDETPGLGIDWNPDAIDRYKIALG